MYPRTLKLLVQICRIKLHPCYISSHYRKSESSHSLKMPCRVNNSEMSTSSLFVPLFKTLLRSHVTIFFKKSMKHTINQNMPFTFKHETHI